MTNTKTFKLEAMIRLTALLATINPTNGYFTTLPSSSIFRGRHTFGENDPLPMVVFIEPPVPHDIPPVPLLSEGRLGQWDIMIQGFVEDDPRNPTDPAYVFVSDVLKCLAKHKKDNQGRNLLGFGQRANTVEDIVIGDEKVRPSDDISAKAYFWLPISLKVAEDLANPLTYQSPSS
jgi:hypothetical protein